jgi:hypothetical protein
MYLSLVQMTHAIAFHMQTDNGYMLVYRCIESPRLKNLESGRSQHVRDVCVGNIRDGPQ